MQTRRNRETSEGTRLRGSRRGQHADAIELTSGRIDTQNSSIIGNSRWFPSRQSGSDPCGSVRVRVFNFHLHSVRIGSESPGPLRPCEFSPPKLGPVRFGGTELHSELRDLSLGFHSAWSRSISWSERPPCLRRPGPPLPCAWIQSLCERAKPDRGREQNKD